MGNTTAIEWTRSEDGTAGYTWNPVSGCTKLSPGCDHCYAENIAHRFSGTKAYPNGFDVTLWPARLDQPIRWTRPRKIFVNSTSDLFHKDIPDEYIAKVWAVMAATPRHTFQILTKRPARMRSLLRSSRFRRQVGDAARALDLTNDLVSIVDIAVQDRWPLENVWLGVSTEDQKWADIRIPELLATPAAVRFISAEPLVGPIELWPFLVPNASVCQAPRHNLGSGKRRGSRHSARCSPRAPRRLPRLSRLDHRRRGLRTPRQTHEPGMGAFTTRPGRQHRCCVPVQAMGRVGTAHRSSILRLPPLRRRACRLRPQSRQEERRPRTRRPNLGRIPRPRASLTCRCRSH